ncbi:MAG TPA: peptidylprolyl isomerase [Kofleriaceae bacterium]|nr:peptidylprolyl isomerase [Kofleriaceae bacterium]
MNHRMFLAAVAAVTLVGASACGQKSNKTKETSTAETQADTDTDTKNPTDRPALDDEPGTEAPASGDSVCAKTPAGEATKTTEVRQPTADDLAGYIADLDGEGKLLATFHTTAGDLHCELLADKAPMTVANFVGLARGLKAWKDPTSGEVSTEPLYNGIKFHRVIPAFMIQGGDPAGNGSGGPGYKFDNESSGLDFDQPGRLAMANAGRNTNGSQFFITEVPYPSLNGGYTLFGTCDDAAVELVKQIARAGNNATTLESVEITCGD